MRSAQALVVVLAFVVGLSLSAPTAARSACPALQDYYEKGGPERGVKRYNMSKDARAGLLKSLANGPESSDSYVMGYGESAQLPQCGHLSFKDKVEGLVFKDSDGDYIFEPIHCRLRRLAASEARKCLEGRHLFFIGDSITRQPWMTLSTFLMQGKIPPPYIRNEKNTEINERTITGSEPMPEGALRDCVKIGCQKCKQFNHDPDELFYARDTQRDIRLTIKTAYMPNPTFTDTAFNALSYAFDLKLLREELEDPDVPPPDMIVMNMGAWWFKKQGECCEMDVSRFVAEWEPVFRKGRELASKNGNKTVLVWRTCTRTRTEENAWYGAWENLDTALAALAHHYGWHVFDVRSITQAYRRQRVDLWVDIEHFAPVVYEQFQDYLLNVLCSTKLRFGARCLFSRRSRRVDAGKGGEEGARAGSTKVVSRACPWRPYAAPGTSSAKAPSRRKRG